MPWKRLACLPAGAVGVVGKDEEERGSDRPSFYLKSKPSPSQANGPTLCIDTSFLGDVLCTEPFIRAVAERWPSQPLDFVTSPAAAPLLVGHPQIRHLMVYDKRGEDKGLRGLLRFAGRLRSTRYERALSTHRSWRTALLLRVARIPVRIGFHNASAAWMYSRRVPYRPELHEIERNLQLVGGGDWERPRVYPSAVDRESVNPLIPQADFVALAPGSIWNTKRWPSRRFAELGTALRQRGFGLVFLGGPQDRVLSEQIMSEMEAEASSKDVLNYCGKTNLRESYLILKEARALVTNDSAPMHLGVAAGIPVMAVYCSTLPSFGFAPRGREDRVFEVTDLPCRPCGIHGRRSCPQEHFRCGWDTQAEQVAKATEQAIQAVRV